MQLFIIHRNFIYSNKMQNILLIKGFYKSFLGYAKSQLKKGVQKPENFKLLTDLQKDISNVINKENKSISFGEAVHTIPELAKYKNI